MVHVLIGFAAAVFVFLVCAGLRWLPAGSLGKILLLAYLLAIGAWAGLSWRRFDVETRTAAAQFSPERFKALTDQVWPAPRPKKVTAAEIDRIVRDVTKRAAGAFLTADEVQGLQEAGQQMIGERRVIDTKGYADSSEIEVFMTDILPYRFRDRIVNRFPDRKTRLFAYSCLLALLGVGVSAVARKAQTTKPADI